jgi:hypothetical protein
MRRQPRRREALVRAAVPARAPTTTTTQSHAEHADPAAHSLIIIARDEILTIKIDYRGAARVPCLTMTRQAIACEQQDQDGPSNERTCAERVM